MNEVAIDQLEFSYDKFFLFKNLKFTLNSGQIIGLVGKNGAGKTSLLKILAGLIFPRQGQCQVFGELPSQRSPTFLSDIYYVPEDFFVPDITATRFEYLYAPFYPKFNHQDFLENLTAFELPLDHRLSKLSYGQRKKFLIAFGLAAHTRLLLLDEPTHHLDIPSKSQFRKLLASAINDEQIFIISTHQVKDMENLIDSLILLDQGQILFHQSMEVINQQLLFEKRPTLAEDRTPLYFHQELGGYSVLCKNEQHIENKVDIETLFNAILADPNKINAVFQKENHHE